jgi:hypothetical protein
MLTQVVTLLTSIRQVTGWKPGRHVAYLHWHSSRFVWASTGKFRKLPSIRPRLLPGTQFSVYNPPVILPSHAAKPRVPEASLNIVQMPINIVQMPINIVQMPINKYTYVITSCLASFLEVLFSDRLSLCFIHAPPMCSSWLKRSHISGEERI